MGRRARLIRSALTPFYTGGSINVKPPATIDRNADKRLRVQNIHVKLTLGMAASRLAHPDRALEQFEEFCTVGQSVRQGIPTTVEVYHSEGTRLK